MNPQMGEPGLPWPFFFMIRVFPKINWMLSVWSLVKAVSLLKLCTVHQHLSGCWSANINTKCFLFSTAFYYRGILTERLPKKEEKKRKRNLKQFTCCYFPICKKKYSRVRADGIQLNLIITTLLIKAGGKTGLPFRQIKEK